MTASENLILLGRVGSHAYGLNTPESDEDFLGVFVAPTTEVAGLYWDSSAETKVNTTPGNDANDTTLHEVAKYMRLALKANPTITELLWLESENYLWDDTLDQGYDVGWGAKLISIRESFLSEKFVRAAYRGYASQQLGKFVSSGHWKPKHAWHCLRLIHQGIQLLRTGELQVRVSDPEVYWRLKDMSSEDVIDLLKRELDGFDEVFATPLPELPNDKPARDLLADIRIAYL